ncbi:phosphoadenosine phosphosulfate reductase [Streptomyces sp. NBC_00264]|uniref:phosphoadenosine phosphosulfate reductase n=1 Tax=unclassified Streptomyces TaxID=2593676 RepID=UPI002255342B|nr:MULTISPECIES: phosphoadenosine phosphosulfate reductase [unclassified Streptomyces]MCX5158122.1 phosphoadenosine phosphosulfate reductase [Streptomyces sp. NBC_00305]MCX5216645.1 phosphoadenosine phosphosulfate reductase [Streptomyces sp. NBC_00264]
MHQPRPVQVISFGGGQQSTALLVLAATGRIHCRTFLFANVGGDSEQPETLRYIEDHAKPYAAKHGLEIVELSRIGRTGPRRGETRTLLADLERPDSKSIPIPVHMNGGGPGTRQCTDRYKIKVIADELARRGATADNPTTVGIGISLDEIHRANNRVRIPHERVVYPLLDLGLRRTDCQRIIRAAGLPIPPKSACWFCPMKRPTEWHELRRTQPDLFEHACRLEDQLVDRRARLGKDPAYLTGLGQPLRQAIPDGVDLLPLDDGGDGACDTGWCMT